MKKFLIIFSVCFVLLLSGFFALQKKSEWKTDVENFGGLNVMEESMDAVTNDFSFFYDISSPKDMLVSNNISVIQGKIKLIIRLDDTKLYEEDLEVGQYAIDTEEVSDTVGKVIVEVRASDDVEGTYSIKINTREKKWYRFKRKIKELFN